jgi:hypothetical protein
MAATDALAAILHRHPAAGTVAVHGFETPRLYQAAIGGAV